MGDLINRDTDVDEYLQIGSDAGEDDLLDWLILAVEAQIKVALGQRILASATYTDLVMDGSGQRELHLDQFPITSVTGVKISADQDFAGATSLTDPGDFLIGANSGMLIRRGGIGSFLNDYSPGGAIWPEGTGNIQITYVGGYVTIPADVKLAACMQVAYLRDRSNQVYGGQGHNEIDTESVGNRSTSHKAELAANALCAPAAALLRQYKSWT